MYILKLEEHRMKWYKSWYSIFLGNTHSMSLMSSIMASRQHNFPNNLPDHFCRSCQKHCSK